MPTWFGAPQVLATMTTALAMMASSCHRQASTPCRKRRHSDTPGGLAVRASVSPDPMPYDADAALTARTAPGAACAATVTYSTGRHPASFDGSARVAGGGGTVSWGWHQKTSGTGGTAAPWPGRAPPPR